AIWRFTRKLIDFHQQILLYRDKEFWGEAGGAAMTWHGVHLNQPDWGDNSHSLSLELSHPKSSRHGHVMFNAYWEALEFELPPLSAGEEWLLAIDTARPSPDDFPDTLLPPQSGQSRYTVQPRSVVVLVTAGTPVDGGTA